MTPRNWAIASTIRMKPKRTPQKIREIGQLTSRCSKLTSRKVKIRMRTIKWLQSNRRLETVNEKD